jgi:ElaA protein
MQIHWEIKHFSELTALEYHNMLQLRVAVFVIEQDCPYPEVDGLDPQCHHLLATDTDTNEIIGTARIIPTKLAFEEVSIGRIVIAPTYRRQKLGSKLLRECIQFIYKHYSKTETPVRIAALKYLEHFYHDFQFKSIREYREYDYDYVEMLLN